ncbi:MAG: YdcF family protein [Egibacteraceae bacterium]
MSVPGRYDLLVILAGDKPARHPVAVELIRRGWARYVAVTGEHEWIDPASDLAGRILPAPASTSTYQDALAARALIAQHRFTSLLVVTAAYQADRARLAFCRVFAELPITIDVLTWESANGTPPAWRILRGQLTEFGKLVYYLARCRV